MDVNQMRWLNSNWDFRSLANRFELSKYYTPIRDMVLSGEIEVDDLKSSLVPGSYNELVHSVRDTVSVEEFIERANHISVGFVKKKGELIHQLVCVGRRNFAALAFRVDDAYIIENADKFHLFETKPDKYEKLFDSMSLYKGRDIRESLALMVYSNYTLLHVGAGEVKYLSESNLGVNIVEGLTKYRQLSNDKIREIESICFAASAYKLKQKEMMC